MIVTILIGLMVLVAAGLIVGGIKSGPDDYGDNPRPFLIGGGVILLVAALVTWFFASFTIVKAAEVGLPVTFGKVGQPMQPGAHLTAPWTSVETFPTRPFGVPDVTITARTSQAGQVKATVGARWHVLPTGARDLYLQVRTGDEQKISEQVIDKSLGQAVGNVFAAKDNMTATTDRLGVESAILAELQRLTAPYGIAIDNVFVRAVEPDAKTADALARVAAQQRATEIATEAQKTAQAEAKRREIEAGSLAATAQQVPNLTPQQVALLCAQTWERMATKAIEAGVPLYTSPCGTSATPVVGK